MASANLAKPLYQSHFPSATAFARARKRNRDKLETSLKRYEQLIGEFKRLAEQAESFDINTPAGAAGATAVVEKIDRLRPKLDSLGNRCRAIAEAGPFENAADRARILRPLRKWNAKRKH
jgi:hypothetical protein